MRRPLGKDAAKYSIRMKLYRAESCENFKSPGPGPGAYKSITKINPNGTYFMSKFENVHPVEFSKDKTERFNNHNDVTPKIKRKDLIIIMMLHLVLQIIN